MQKINSNLRFKGEERWSLYRRKLQSTTLLSLKILYKLVYVQAFFINELKYIITFLSFTTLVRSFVRSILVLLCKKKAMAMFNIFVFDQREVNCTFLTNLSLLIRLRRTKYMNVVLRIFGFFKVLRICKLWNVALFSCLSNSTSVIWFNIEFHFLE